MSKPRKKDVTYSRVSVKSQTVLPRAVRELLAVKPGDTIRYRITERGVLIDKAPPAADDPFVEFSEWAGPHDDEDYGGL